MLGLESPNMENFKKIKLLIIESNPVDAEALMDIFGDCNDIAIYGASSS